MTKNSEISRRGLLGAGATIAATAAVGGTSQAQSMNSLPAGIRGANVSLIASAMGKSGMDASKYAMSPDIKPLVEHGETIIGPAITCKWEIGKLDDVEDINKYVYDPLGQAPAGSVWVIESGTEEIFSMFGDIITQSCKQRGMLGAVTDNGCRDIVEMKKQGFAVFAKTTIPYGPKGLKPTGANVPITCGGVDINPGDLIAADIDGVIVIPKDKIDELAEGVAKHLAFEKEVRIKVDAGETLRNAYPY
ncbi:MAG: RraA family protein [Emcibacteraceae bacterium]|nr:RraA family protein [Emcibacteraceae bacterium]MDG1858959.1 RraA family protein [Emcibacteraceae bacterium]